MKWWGGFHSNNFSTPANGNSTDANAVIDQRAGGHGNGRRREDFELNPGRREGLEIVRFGKEGKDVVKRTGKPELSLESKFLHSEKEHWAALLSIMIYTALVQAMDEIG